MVGENIQLHVTEIDALVRKGYLENENRDNQIAVQAALDAFVSDALFEA
jgi:hypothetical protein